MNMPQAAGRDHSGLPGVTSHHLPRCSRHQCRRRALQPALLRVGHQHNLPGGAVPPGP
jgi:hypothetical protein